MGHYQISCHRMLHKGIALLDIEDLKEMINAGMD